MAAIVNDRDLLLQAANPRTTSVQLPPFVMVPGVVGIDLVARSNFFHISTTGVATPTELTINALLHMITGVVTWEVIEGQITLIPPAGGSNLSRVVQASSMGTDIARVQASVTFEGVLYTDEITITKIRDGGAGAAGVRGTVAVTVAVGAPVWSDTAAFNRIQAVTGGLTILIADMVTETYGGNWAETRGWDGANWIIVQNVFSGNMLVNGAILANHMSANSITATNGALADLTVTSAKVYFQIQSDNYNGAGLGWAINRDGNAAFNNVSIFGFINAGTKVRDTATGGQLLANAVANASGSVGSTVVQTGTDDVGAPIYSLAIHAPVGARLGGPAFHSGIEVRQRIRMGDASNPIVISVNINAIVDNYFTLWYQVNGTGQSNTWLPLASITEPKPDVGPVTLNAVLITAVGFDTWIQFGVSASTPNGDFYNVFATAIDQYTMTALAINV